MAALSASYDVTSGDESSLATNITPTQTSGIKIAPMNINGDSSTAWTCTTGGVIQVEQQIDGTRKVEWIAYGGGTVNADNSFTLSDVSRNVSRSGSSFTGTGTGQRFDKTATVKLVTFHLLLNKKANVDRDNAFPSLQTFAAGINVSGKYVGLPVYADTTARDAAIPSPTNGQKVYVTGVGEQVYSGGWVTVNAASNSFASSTVSGTVELAIASERATGAATGGSGGPLAISNDALVKTSSGAGDENKIPVLNAVGQLASGFINVNSVPTGAMFQWLTNTAPTGYLLCYGQAVSRATYSDLFTLISTTYGSGDGSTTFNLPDIRGRLPLGQDDMGGSSANRVTATEADNLGQASGAETHTLTTSEMPSHSHTLIIQTGGGSSADKAMYGGGSNDTSMSTATAGSGGAHNNMPPYITVNYIIKT